jgi:hypothetical protein
MSAALNIDETFLICNILNHRIQDSKVHIIGELRSARHAYLYWLEGRKTASPKWPPNVQEARRLAAHLGRRAPDVWKEIGCVWALEQGNGGRVYRENRLTYMGEDLDYDGDAKAKSKEKKKTMCMWG